MLSYCQTAHKAAIIAKFIEFIDERITCLVTDGGNEWAGILPLTEKYGFVWKRKNVALTGHSAMARLFRSVGTKVLHEDGVACIREERE